MFAVLRLCSILKLKINPMKNLLLLCAAFFLISIQSVAQTYAKGTVTLMNNTTIDGNIRLDYSQQKVFIKNNPSERGYDLSSVERITLNKRDLEKRLVEDQTYFTYTLVNGRASLYQIGDDQYLIAREDGLSRTLNTKEQQNTIPGILAVLFNDCNSIRATLNNVDEYNASNLQKVTETYNNCSYEAFAPTEKEVRTAARFNTDVASFYLGIGGGLSDIRFFDSDNGESIGSFQGQLGVIATPSFLGSQQGNIFFSLEAQAAFASDNEFSNVSRDINFRLNTYRVLLGLEYLFNKEGTFKPYLGIAAGVTSDSYKGSVDNNDFDISGGNPIVIPKIGFRYLLNNSDHLGLTLSYITGYENDLTFPTQQEIIPLAVDVQTITLGINYYF